MRFAFKTSPQNTTPAILLQPNLFKLVTVRAQ
jgi:hypothetical protein